MEARTLSSEPEAELCGTTTLACARSSCASGSRRLKTAPRGYPADHPRIGLLRHKGLIAWKEWPVEAWLGTPAARTHIAGFLVAARPLSSWLDTHVGSDGG